MATVSARRKPDPRSGGKILKNRRPPAASRTPYSRPIPPERSPPPPEESENPNWFSGLLFPAKMIASGAGKIFSLFGPDSSSSSSSGGDTSENDDYEEDGIENDISFQGDDRSDKVLSPVSKSDNKRAIEQLVLQETFSREEGNKLIKLIKSRVVDTNGAFDESTPQVRTTAIMEARKWLQEKRSGSKKKSEKGLDLTGLATPSQVTRSDKGSPVDMAKSYMQNRPAWASPSLKHTEFGSPPPFGMQHFKEETPKSTLRSSELKRNSLTSGSWNILEEIRRVRSKATEELLAATPLTKIGLSSFSRENNPPRESLMNNRVVEEAVATGSTHDGPHNALPEVTMNFACRVNQDGNAVQSMEHLEAAESKSNKDHEELNELSTAAENGFVSSAPGLAAGHDTTQKPKQSDEENGNLVGSSQVRTDVHMEENLNLQEEPATDNPTSNPDETMVNGSQNSSSIQHEELSQELTQPTGPRTSTAKGNNAQKERKSRGYTRRGRGRGK